MYKNATLKLITQIKIIKSIIEKDEFQDIRYKPKIIFGKNAAISFCIDYETFVTLFLETAQKISDTIINNLTALSGKLIIILSHFG